MILSRSKRRKNGHDDLEASTTTNKRINGTGPQPSLGFQRSNLIPSRGILWMLGFLAIVYSHFNQFSPTDYNTDAILEEIPSVESNFEYIQSVGDSISTRKRGLLSDMNNVPSDPLEPVPVSIGSQPTTQEQAQPVLKESEDSDEAKPKPQEQEQPVLEESEDSDEDVDEDSDEGVDGEEDEDSTGDEDSNDEDEQVVELPPQRQNEEKQVVTVIAQLNGELGNQMHKIANAICVQKHIEGKLKLKTELKLRAQDSPKWRHAMEWMKEAFPKTRSLDFRAGNSEVFDYVQQIQQEWIDYLIKTKQVNLKGIGNPNILNHMKSSGWQPTMEVLRLLNQTWYLDRPSAPESNTEFSIPHVYSDTFTSRYCFEKYLPEIRAFFKLDQYKVCKQKPQPDESVLHLRNFLTEMGDVGKELGFEELSPNKTATEIFKDYPPGSKVAIVSRYPNRTDEYIKALKDIRGIEARYIAGQTGNQDFCFLMKTRQEIIGQRISTFATWAGLLGKPKKLRLYSVDSKHTRAKKKAFFTATWKHPELKQLIVYENYKA